MGAGGWEGEQVVTVAGSETAASVAGLEARSAYKVRVLAVNGVGVSGGSADLVVRTEEEAPSDLPSSVRADSLSSRTIRVNWSYASPAFDGFYVGFREVLEDKSTAAAASRSLYSFKTLDLPPTSTGHQAPRDFHVLLTDLKRNTRYGIIVQAFNRKGSGPASGELLVQTSEFGPSFLLVC